MQSHYKSYHDLAHRLGLICGRKYRIDGQRIFHTHSTMFEHLYDKTKAKCFSEFYSGFWSAFHQKQIGWSFYQYKNIDIISEIVWQTDDEHYHLIIRIHDDFVRSNRLEETLESCNTQQQFDSMLEEQLQAEIEAEIAKKEANKTYVYFVGSKDHGFIKVGISKKDSLKNRLSSIQTSCPFKIKKYKAIQVNDRHKALAIEYSLHKYLKNKGNHSNGEWFYNDENMQRLMSMKKSEIIKRFAS